MIAASQFQSTTASPPQSSAQSAQGLVRYHISPRKEPESPSVSIFADLVTFKIPSSQQLGGGLRGIIRGFTPQSRKRFMESFAKARDTSSGQFCSLTYPATWPADPATWHTQLDTLLKRLVRWQPGTRGWWRLEFQKRGAPHFHVLIFGAKANTRQVRRWLKVAWYVIVASGDPKHLSAGTQADLIHNRKHAGRYIAKYAAKVETNAATSQSKPTGRLWGTFGSHNQSPILTVKLAAWQIVEVKRLLVRWLHSRASSYERRLANSPERKGFSVFGAGDQSNDAWALLENSTIFRMIEPFYSG